MMKQPIILMLIVLCLAVWTNGAEPAISQKDFKRIFDEHGVHGTFLVYDMQKNTHTAFNEKRTRTPFLPASTFKVPNSLIILESGTVKDENEIIKWDGVKRFYDKWNADHDLKSALKYSAVWVYQELARRVGMKKMQHWLDKINYGNRKIAGEIDTFWLEGGLRITAHQQIDFLKKLYTNRLPFSQRSMDIVKEILIVEKTDAYTLRAKTGWAARVKPQIGWYVGWLERGDEIYLFAMNIDVLKNEDTKARYAITKKVFQTMGLME